MVQDSAKLYVWSEALKPVREEGVDSTIDQYLLAPPEVWPRWWKLNWSRFEETIESQSLKKAAVREEPA
jgi:hypothetical protein